MDSWLEFLVKWALVGSFSEAGNALPRNALQAFLDQLGIGMAVEAGIQASFGHKEALALGMRNLILWKGSYWLFLWHLQKQWYMAL